MKRAMNKRLGGDFWGESILASVAAALAVLTLAWPDWIEGVFGVDPDGHSGSLEWTIVAICCVNALVLSALARRAWRRAALGNG